MTHESALLPRNLHSGGLCPSPLHIHISSLKDVLILLTFLIDLIEVSLVHAISDGLPLLELCHLLSAAHAISLLSRALSLELAVVILSSRLSSLLQQLLKLQLLQLPLFHLELSVSLLQLLLESLNLLLTVNFEFLKLTLEQGNLFKRGIQLLLQVRDDLLRDSIAS